MAAGYPEPGMAPDCTSPNLPDPKPENETVKKLRAAAIHVSGDMIYLLSPDRILLENERNLLKELQAMEQERLGQLEAATL
jgi:hypothetical protein